MPESTTPTAHQPTVAPHQATVDLAELLKDRSPLKLVTGTQTSQGLTFELHPGAIVAHPGSAVLFVCG